MEEKDFWKTPRGKALIKLGLWGIFLIVIFAFATIDTPNRSTNLFEEEEVEEKEVVQFLLYADMIRNLEKNNYMFSYTIKSGERTIFLSGKQMGDEITGLKETDKGDVTKYYINKDRVYKVILGNLEIIEDFYEFIDPNMLDMNAFFTSLAGVTYKVEKHDETRNIIYDTLDYSVVVETDLENITNITYINGDKEYILSFQSIGKVEEISYNR